jgi:hypothetical protein
VNIYAYSITSDGDGQGIKGSTECDIPSGHSSTTVKELFSSIESDDHDSLLVDVTNYRDFLKLVNEFIKSLIYKRKKATPFRNVAFVVRLVIIFSFSFSIR